MRRGAFGTDFTPEVRTCAVQSASGTPPNDTPPSDKVGESSRPTSGVVELRYVRWLTTLATEVHRATDVDDKAQPQVRVSFVFLDVLPIAAPPHGQTR